MHPAPAGVRSGQRSLICRVTGWLSHAKLFDGTVVTVRRCCNVHVPLCTATGMPQGLLVRHSVLHTSWFTAYATKPSTLTFPVTRSPRCAQAFWAKC